MAYDPELAERLREQLAEVDNVTEKRMFGGLAFLVNGHLAMSASRHGGMMVRVGAEGSDEALSRPHARLIEMRGRPMTGWIFVEHEGVRTKRQLQSWVRRGLKFVHSLPPKRGGAAARGPRPARERR